jgi:single-stranded DNA-binding protein
LRNQRINNNAEIAGGINGEFLYSHEAHGELFYNFQLSVPRLSGNSDSIVVTASERLLRSGGYKPGDNVYITGQFRSYNNYSPHGNKLILTVFAKEMELIGAESRVNAVTLNGYVCKTPVYRTTPFGREISDLLVAVNRAYGKSDYIPCIAWGRNAKFAADLRVGEQITVSGRIQSREYQKKIDETEFLTKTAYEVSISKITTYEDFPPPL